MNLKYICINSVAARLMCSTAVIGLVLETHSLRIDKVYSFICSTQRASRVIVPWARN